MSEYQYLTSEIQVPKEWQVEIARQLFVNFVKNAIIRYRRGQRVVITIKNVSALITKVENKPKYLLERIEEINDEGTFRMELILPSKIVMLPFQLHGIRRGEQESLQCMPMVVKSNDIISPLIVLNPESHKVLTLIPDVKKILKLKGITGPERYNYVFQTTYTIQKNKWLKNSVLEIDPIPSTSAGPSTSQEQVTDDEWTIVTYDRLEPPK
uniref:BV12 family protein n=1 Tax=Cotesia sesamiae Mombasa bracovirus TaxID=452649 RepID=R9XL31_9VIRU|nr:BV12 family protein [Cotesia sesamiae Mombasa bracovirus]